MNPLIVPILSSVIILNFMVGIVILSRSLKNKVNLLFGLISLGVSLWAVGILGFYLLNIQPESLWIIETHFCAAAIAVLFLLFTFIFPKLLIKNNYIRTSPLIPFSIIAFFLFFTKSIIGNTHGISYEINNGYIFYSFFIMVCFFIGYYSLFLQYKNSSNDEQKIQVKYVFGGAILSSLLASVSDLILPYFGVFEYTWLGPIFTFFMVGAIAYAILKHHLFDIRVVATELFTFAIWLVLLIKVFFSNGVQDFFVNISLLLAVVFFGTMMIRAVIREVKQREKIEKMAKDMETAYEIEKKARQELERLDGAKNQFLLTIQHHLRTPLTSMMGYSDLLLSNHFGKVPVKIREIIVKFQVSAESLIKMVNEFLDITQFQLGKEVISLKPGVDINPIMAEIVNDLTLEAGKKGIYLKLEKPEHLPLIKADAEKLKAALTNVIDNAVKYTDKGGVEIKITNGDNLTIKVSDTGIGISEIGLKNLFEKIFERGERAKKAFVTGRGIGVYIAGQIIKAHNGKIWAESGGEGKGSVFFIELPIEKNI